MPPKLSTQPMPLNELLQYLQSQFGLTMRQGVQIAGTLIKQQHNTAAKLAVLSTEACVQLGIDDSQIRKLLVSRKSKGKGKDGSPRKRSARDADLDEDLPTSEPRERIQTSLEVKEEIDEDVLATQSVVVNRAPVMCAWATIVAERLSFSRQEALSLAQAYTEANAQAKGVSIGVLDAPKKSPGDASSAQPFVELMGRKVPVIAQQDEQWRGLIAGKTVEPEKAFGYMSRSFRQQMGSVFGAMRMLANSFPPHELNNKGYGLYTEFRPVAGGWGEKSELKLADILKLRRHLTHKQQASVKSEGSSTLSSPSKRIKLEEDGVDVKPKVHLPSDAAKDEFDDLLDDELDLGDLPV